MPLITITHTIGCDALTIARRVADGLTVEIYDDSRLREEAFRMGLHTDQLKGFQEKAPDWFEKAASDRLFPGREAPLLTLGRSKCRRPVR